MQKKIVNEMKVKPVIDVEYEIKNRINFIKNSLLNSGAKSLVLGISGGQDSTLCAKLAQMAIDELGESYTFIAVRLPYNIQFDEQDCQIALDFIKPDLILSENIAPSTDALVAELAKSNIEVTDFNKGNIKARIRMVTQYAIAGEHNALVLGTDHSAENITGFFTKHGDGACDIAPLFGLNKRQGKMLLEYLGAPSSTYLKVPTADLEDDKQGLADEVALGVTYDQIDDYLEGISIEPNAANRIESLYTRSIHKRKLPTTIYDV